MGNDKEIGVDPESTMSYLSLANRRNADEGNRNIIRNPPIPNDSEQGDLRKIDDHTLRNVANSWSGGHGQQPRPRTSSKVQT